MTKFIQNFEKKVKETIQKYKLANKKEKIIVACSGGKDSTTTLYLLKKFGYNIEALIIDLHIGEWSKKNLENIKSFCKELGVKLHVIDMKKELGKDIHKLKTRKVCFICGINKRWLLNKKSRELGAKKVAMGHNLDDEAESILMNLFRGNIEFGLNSGPKVLMSAKEKKFVQRIRPLFFLLNKDVKKYSQDMKLPILHQLCPHSKYSYRRQIRTLLNKLSLEDSKVKSKIVKWFMEKQPELREKYASKDSVNYCEKCGEPCRNVICKKCELMTYIK